MRENGGVKAGEGDISIDTHVAAGFVKFLRQLFERIFLSCHKCNSISLLSKQPPGTETVVSTLTHDLFLEAMTG